MSVQRWHALNCVFACVCVIPTWSIQEIFDLEAEQRGRDARFIVHLSCYCLQPKHIIVQRLWQSLSWVWTKKINKLRKRKKRRKGVKGKEENRTDKVMTLTYLTLRYFK